MRVSVVALVLAVIGSALLINALGPHREPRQLEHKRQEVGTTAAREAKPLDAAMPESTEPRVDVLAAQKTKAIEAIRSATRFAFAAGYVDFVGGDIYGENGVPNTSFGLFDQDESGWFWWFAKDGSKLHEAQFRTNNVGLFANRRYQLATAPLEYRIVVVGDEMTAATTGGNLWPDRVEDILNSIPALTDTVGQIRVFNVGHPDQFPSDFVTMAIEIGTLLDPDMIVANVPEHAYYRIQPIEYLSEEELQNPKTARRVVPTVKAEGRFIELSGTEGQSTRVQLSCWGGATTLADLRCDTGFPLPLLLSSKNARGVADNPQSIRAILESFSNQYARGIVNSMTEEELLKGPLDAASLLARRLPVPTLEASGPRFRPPSTSELVANVGRQLHRLTDRFSNVLILHNPFYPHVTGTPLTFTKMLAETDPAVAPIDTRDRLLARLGDADPKTLWTVPAAAEKWSARGHALYAEVVAERIIKTMVADGTLAPLNAAEAVDSAVAALAAARPGDQDDRSTASSASEIDNWAAGVALGRQGVARDEVASRAAALLAREIHGKLGTVRRTVALLQGVAATDAALAVAALPVLEVALEATSDPKVGDWAWSRLARTFLARNAFDAARNTCGRVTDRVVAHAACLSPQPGRFVDSAKPLAPLQTELPDGEVAVHVRAKAQALRAAGKAADVTALASPLLATTRLRMTTWVNIVLPALIEQSKSTFPAATTGDEVRRWWRNQPRSDYLVDSMRNPAGLAGVLDLLDRGAAKEAAALARAMPAGRFASAAAAAAALASKDRTDVDDLLTRVTVPDIRVDVLSKLIAKRAAATQDAEPPPLAESLVDTIKSLAFADLRVAAAIEGLRQDGLPTSLVDRLLRRATNDLGEVPPGIARDRLYADLAVAAARHERDMEALALIAKLAPGPYRDLRLAELVVTFGDRDASKDAQTLRSVPSLTDLPAEELWRAAAPAPLTAGAPVALWRPGAALPL